MKQGILFCLVIFTVFACKSKSGRIDCSLPIESNVVIPEMYRGMAENENNQLGGLMVGDKAPLFVLDSSEDKEVNIENDLKKGPVVLLFYRGHWCPKCTLHLESLEQDLLVLKERGIFIYAITPESDEFIDMTIEKSATSIPIIYDKNEDLMKAYKVYYKVSDDYVDGLEKNHGQVDAFLPVPATYVIGQSGKIVYRHYEHDYGNRASMDDILKALK